MIVQAFTDALGKSAAKQSQILRRVNVSRVNVNIGLWQIASVSKTEYYYYPFGSKLTQVLEPNYWGLEYQNKGTKILIGQTLFYPGPPLIILAMHITVRLRIRTLAKSRPLSPSVGGLSGAPAGVSLARVGASAACGDSDGEYRAVCLTSEACSAIGADLATFQNHLPDVSWQPLAATCLEGDSCSTCGAWGPRTPASPLALCLQATLRSWHSFKMSCLFLF